MDKSTGLSDFKKGMNIENLGLLDLQAIYKIQIRLGKLERSYGGTKEKHYNVRVVKDGEVILSFPSNKKSTVRFC